MQSSSNSSAQGNVNRASMQELRSQSASTSSSSAGSSSSSTNLATGTSSANRNSTVTPISVFYQELRASSASVKQQQEQRQQQSTQASSSGTSSGTSSADNNQELNRCYICFGTDEDSVGRWVKPCQCTLISHEDCLLDWIDKNRQQFAKKQVWIGLIPCWYRPKQLTLFTMSDVQFATHAYAVLTVCGTVEGEKLLGSPNPWSWRVWTGLPLIPVILIFSRTKAIDSFMPLIPLLIVGNEQLQVTFPPSPALTLSVMPWVRMVYNSLWADMVSRLETRWRRQQIAGSGVARLGMNASIEATDTDSSTANAATVAAAAAAEEELSFFDRKDLGRTIVGALLMPAISSICGSFLGHFSFVRTRIPDNFHRNILGGCLFVLMKDLAGLVGTYHEIKRKRVRRIREYAEFKDERP
ncbi:hypothetical protein FBU30_008168 [Linnemannia zychae]|nr:hypothetical protein FBU30_008168 [Linnemannia zychae]